MMALIAAKAALSDEGHLNKVLDNNRKGKEYFYDSFEALGLEAASDRGEFRARQDRTRRGKP